MVVLGSGGHTAEMLMLLRGMDKAFYAPRCYVVAETDRMSGTKALALERDWAQYASGSGSGSGSGSSSSSSSAAGGDGSQAAAPALVTVIPRSREVGQSYLTSVGTTLYSLAFAAMAVLKWRPQLVLVNGPGTCIPVCAAALLYRVLGVMDCRIVYVESIARVRKLSLSGLILYFSRAADVVLTQWPELQQRYPRTVCVGRLY